MTRETKSDKRVANYEENVYTIHLILQECSQYSKEEIVKTL